jgi:hypothetical protein
MYVRVRGGGQANRFEDAAKFYGMSLQQLAALMQRGDLHLHSPETTRMAAVRERRPGEW